MKPHLFNVIKVASILPLLGAAALHANLLDFDFSFTNTIGDVSGTVTGEIVGLSDNSTSSASQVLIESFPSGLDNIFASLPIDATTWDQQYQNSFTVVGGQVVSGGFWAEQSVDGYQQGAQLYVNGVGYNFLNLDGNDTRYVWGDDGFAAANIVPAGSSVPDAGSSLALLTAALMGIGAVARKVRA
jgi:hypothetical protein